MASTAKDGEILDGIKGTLRFVGAHKKMNPEDSEPFTVQSITLGEIESGIPKIDCDVYNHPDLAYLVGRNISIVSTKSRNGRYGGVSISRERRNPFSPGITRVRISKMAEISPANDRPE